MSSTRYISRMTRAGVLVKSLISATAGAKVDEATIQNKIKIIQQEAVGAVLKKLLTEAQTDKTRTAIQVDNAQMKEIANKIMLGWDKLNIDQREMRVKEQLMQWTTDPNREAIHQAIGTLNSIMHTLKRGTTINNWYE